MDSQFIGRSSKNFNLDNNDIVTRLKKSGEELAPLNRLASYICNTPVSMVNLLDNNFQFTVSKYGKWEGQTTPKEETVCQFTIEEDEILVINDTDQDRRTNSIKELKDNPSIRFYAGVPINSPDGSRIGAFCAIDKKPKKLSEKQKQALKDLGKEVEIRIKLLEQKAAVEDKNEILEEASAFLDNSADIFWVIDPVSFKIRKSDGAESILGCKDSHVVGRILTNLIEEINIKNHIQHWIDKQNSHPKLGIPVKISLQDKEEVWLRLTFSKYKESLLVTGRDITKQYHAEQKLKQSLDEKEILLAEVHHRVKNNLAVIKSLLELERYKAKDEHLHNVLLNSESRIISIAQIHESLYKSNDFANIQLESYINELISHLIDSFTSNQSTIKIDLKVEPFSINVNQALPLGLIINELITNAFQHAFTQKKSGQITVLIIEKTKDIVQVEVSDDGKGLDMTVSELEEKGDLGFKLISTLVDQINAEIEIRSNNGTTFKFTFPKDARKGSVNAM